MRYTPLYYYYWFGLAFRYLQDVNSTYTVKGESVIEGNLNNFLRYLDEFKLVVTKRVASAQLREISDRVAEYEEDQKISEKDASNLRNAMSKIKTTLDAEFWEIGAYMPTPKVIDIKKLLENVSELFSPSVFDGLPEIARFDFEDAGKCIAFDLPTAAAFHVLRGTEGALRDYYTKMVRRGRIKSLNWGPTVNDLRKRKKTQKYNTLNDRLDYIRAQYRNPTNHPDIRYDIHQAQDLWGICVEVINTMVRILGEEGIS